MYPDNWTPRYQDAQTITHGTVCVHVPARTPEQEAAFLRGIDAAVRKACPGRRLKGGEAYV